MKFSQRHPPSALMCPSHTLVRVRKRFKKLLTYCGAAGWTQLHGSVECRCSRHVQSPPAVDLGLLARSWDLAFYRSIRTVMVSTISSGVPN